MSEVLKTNPKVDPGELARIRERLELAEGSGYPKRRRQRVTPPGSRRRVRVIEDSKRTWKKVKRRRAF